MIRLQLYLPEDLYDTVKTRATKEGKPAAQVIREALVLGLQQQPTSSTLGQTFEGILNIGKKLQLDDGATLSTHTNDYLYGK